MIDIISAILFDFDGVIVSRIGFKKYRKFGNNLPFVYKQWTKALVGSISEDEFWKTVCEKCGLDINKAKTDLYNSPVLRKNVIKIAEKLKKDYVISITSDHAPDFFSFLDKKYKITKNFDHVFTSFDLHLTKQRKSFFEYVLKKLEIKPEECLLIDDRPENVKNACSIGIKTIYLKKARELSKQLRKA